MARSNIGNAYIQVTPSFQGASKLIEKQMGGAVDSAVRGLEDGSRGSNALAGALGKAAGAAKVAMGAVTGIGTAVAGIAIKKGLDRALQIENAEAKLSGLGHSADTITSAMDSALQSVRGTAFGMGDAATSAASAMAAGVKEGEDLTRVLKITADSAQIMGTEFGESGAIINKVLANQKISMGEVNQLHDAGLPILAMLAEQYGVTSAEMSKMVSEGVVDSESFLKALETNIGGAALKSADTTQGAFANMMAALGRMGLSLVGGIFPLFKGVFLRITQTVDNLTEAFKPLGEAAGVWAEKNFLPAFNKVMDWIDNDLISSLSSIGSGIMKYIVNPLRQMKDFIDNNVITVFDRISSSIASKVRPAMEEWGTWLQGPAVTAWETYSTKVKDSWGDTITWLQGPGSAAFDTVSDTVETAYNRASGWLNGPGGTALKTSVVASVTGAWVAVKTYVDGPGQAQLEGISGGIQRAWGSAAEWASGPGKDILGSIVDTARGSWDDLHAWVDGPGKSVVDGMKTNIETIASSVGGAWLERIEVLGGQLADDLLPAILRLAEAIGTEFLPEILGIAAELSTTLLPVLNDLSLFISTKIIPIVSRLVDAFTATKEIWVPLTVTAIGFFAAVRVGTAIMAAYRTVVAVATGIKLAYMAATGKAVLATGRHSAALVIDSGATTANSIARARNTIATAAGTAAAVVQRGALLAGAAAMKIVTGAQWLWNAAMSANPIGLIIAAIAALVAGFIWAWNNLDGFKEFFIAAWEKIKVAWSAAGEFFKALWDGIVQVAKAIWNGILAYFSWLLNTIKTIWTGVWNAFVAIFKGIWDGIVAYYTFIINTMITLWTGIWNTAKAVFSAVWNAIKTIVAGVWDFIKSSASAAWEGLKVAWSSAGDFFQGVWDGVKNIFTNTWQAIKDSASKAWDFLKQLFEWTPLGLVIKNWGSIVDWFKDAFKGIGDFFSNLMDGVMDTIKGSINIFIRAINWITSKMNEISVTVPDWVPKIGGQQWGFNIPAIPELATGATVTGPTVALIGEKDPETVVDRGLMNAALGEVYRKLVNQGTAIGGGSREVRLDITVNNNGERPLGDRELAKRIVEIMEWNEIR